MPKYRFVAREDKLSFKCTGVIPRILLVGELPSDVPRVAFPVDEIRVTEVGRRPLAAYSYSFVLALHPTGAAA